MRILEKEFEGRADTKGWHFHQIRRNKRWALYERKRGEETTYELIRVRQFGVDKRYKGRVIAQSGDEYYPCASDWGKHGFTYGNRETAEAAYSNRIRR